MASRAAVLVPVGPDPQELDRTADLLDSLFSHEPDVARVVLIDDASVDRHLDERFSHPSSCRLTSLPNPRYGAHDGLLGGLCAGMVAGLRHLADLPDLAFVLKIDTDALVMGPFVDAITAAFADPLVGMVGAYDRTPTGEVRDVRRWGSVVEQMSLPGVRYPLSRGRWLAARAVLGPEAERRAARIAARRAAILAARKHGYQWGEHCQGGAYAVSSTALRRMSAAQHLADPLLWLETPLAEDALVSLLVRAVDLRLVGMAGRGQPFGIRHLGLAGSCAWLVENGYGIIHSLKNDPRATESEIRAFFRARRRLSSVPPLG